MPESLLQNPAITAVSLLLAATSVILAIVFYFKGKREKKACYTLSSWTLIESKSRLIEGLAITYKDQACDRITVTNLGIWNAGNESLRPQDIATTDPLTVQVDPGANVLSLNVIFTSDESNRFSVNLPEAESDASDKAPTNIHFTFEYLDPQQGAVIQIIHNGVLNHKVEVKGKIIGGHPWESSWSPYQRLSMAKSFILRQLDDPRRATKQNVIVAFSLLIFGLLSTTSPFVGLVIAAIGFLMVLVFILGQDGGTPKDILEHLGHDTEGKQ